MVICGTADEDRRLLAESAATDSFPPVDVIISGACVTILADIAGALADDICVYINYDKLVIEGVKRPYYPPCYEMKFLCAERQYRAFKREIRLKAPILKDTIETSFCDGVLKISWMTE
ncbi:MAG: Hsp20/alpha crystallin family protein [Deferribacteraceae bacterium]|jgi:HSP20 family molecular chaperone IbpA|nr:Hsp20/alpha crystallin family protein [Deferribacteraceae bacterium]